MFCINLEAVLSDRFEQYSSELQGESVDAKWKVQTEWWFCSNTRSLEMVATAEWQIQLDKNINGHTWDRIHNKTSVTLADQNDY